MKISPPALKFFNYFFVRVSMTRRKTRRTGLTFRCVSLRDASNPRMSKFLAPIVERVGPASAFGLQYGEKLSAMSLREKIVLLLQNNYGALVSFRGREPAGLLAFQDHADGSRHAFLVHVLPEQRGRGIAHACALEFVRNGLKQGIQKFRLSPRLAGRDFPNARKHLLEKIHSMKESLGVKVNKRNGFIQKQ